MLFRSLKVNLASGIDTSGGILRAGLDTQPMRSAVATWDTFDSHEDYLSCETRTVAQGVTVGMPWQDNNEFTGPSSHRYPADWEGRKLPCVRVESALANTVLKIDAVLYVQIVRNHSSAFPAHRVIKGPNWDVVREMTAAGAYDHIVDGNSFKSFLSGLARIGVKIGKFIYKYREEIIAASSLILV